MKTIYQSHKVLRITRKPIELIEQAGRVCYASEMSDAPEGSKAFVRNLIKRGHESVIEHASATILFITSRSVTHELVRHRLCAFSQESQRYVNGLKHGIEFIENIEGPQLDPALLGTLEVKYRTLIKDGYLPQHAREILPNCTATRIVVTANFREWRHIFKLRTSKAAHPQIRALMIAALKDMQNTVPVIFEGII